MGLHLGITTNTVKKHISNIYSKLNISSRPQLVRFIIVKGFVHFWEQP
ncbi:MAG: helix-turn-helix transcriptional regulator [Anaerovoracaceae bacterium]